ncbi:MAG: tyrosine-type recombinase/integrase [Deltaproteobacteria bacterium]|nr:tyrosine-type recombinase/integrase [Deltaproteobacteria bacterium]
MEQKKTPSIYQKRDGKWYCTLWGKQRYLGKTIDIARERLKEILEAKEEPQRNEAIGDLSEAYLASLANNQSPDTIRTKAGTYRAFIEFVGRRTSVRAITPETIERYKQRCFARRLKRQTVRSKLLNLSALFEYAVRKKLVKTNPVRSVSRIDAPADPNPDYLTEDEEAKLLSLTEEQRYPWLWKRDRLLFLSMLHAGLRRKEAADFTWPDIDFDRRILVVRNGKGGKHRLVGLSDTLYEALRDFYTNERKSDTAVLTTISGRALSRESLWHIAKKYIARLNHHYRGRGRFSLHSLRATFATRLCERGTSTRVVQSLLGHSDPRTTMRYAAVSETALIEAARRLG